MVAAAGPGSHGGGTHPRGGANRTVPPCQNRVMLRMGTVVVGVQDMDRAVTFWSRALGYVPRDGKPDPGEDFAVLVPSDGLGPGLSLQVSETPAQEYPRVHLDLYAAGAAEQAAEVERLISLGATRPQWDRYGPDADFIVLADTEGNRFCVVDTAHVPQPVA